MVPLLATARLRLRGWVEADLDAYAAIQSDPEVMRFLGVGPAAGKPRTRAESWASIAMFMGQWALRGTGSFAVERIADRALIGRVGILHPEAWPEPELAYTLARDAWGQGHALEACRAVLDWAWSSGRVGSLASFVHPANHRSLRLVERLGATPEGEATLLGVPCLVWRHVPPGGSMLA
jgi:RimJ/RimL family protein N-acetyltransferase